MLRLRDLGPRVRIVGGQLVRRTLASAANGATRFGRFHRRIGSGGTSGWDLAREQFKAQGLVLTWVASALVVRQLLGAREASATFLFYPVVVVCAAWRGGWVSGLVASAGSLLASRVFDNPGVWTSALFLSESLIVTALVVALVGRLQERTATLNAANERLGLLHEADRHARTLDVGARSLESLSPEHALVLLDRQGFVTEWRTSAQRLYGLPPDAVRGRSAARLFPDGDADTAFRALLTEAERGMVVRKVVWQRRHDNSFFEADVELALSVGVGGDGFAMVIRDRTLEYERQVNAAAADSAHRALQDEAERAQRQLAALQSVTDPSLNAWSAAHLVAELLDRLRDVVHADGIALVLFRGAKAPRVYSTPDGLHPEGVSEKALSGFVGQAGTRVTFVQNDAARVADQSLLCWPAGTTSLIAVPVVQAGEVEGMIEVADQRGRRSTEWEIALVQVVAARVAGLAREHGYIDSAVA